MCHYSGVTLFSIYYSSILRSVKAYTHYMLLSYNEVDIQYVYYNTLEKQYCPSFEILAPPRPAPGSWDAPDSKADFVRE